MDSEIGSTFMDDEMNLLLVLGNQLFSKENIQQRITEKLDHIFMREDQELCTYFKFHKHKITFFLSSMRTYAEEIESLAKVHYEKLNSTKSKTYDEALSDFVKAKKVKKVYYFEIEDKFFEKRIRSLLKDLKVEAVEVRSPLFLTSRAELQEHLGGKKRPFMKTFYEKRRKDLKILLTKEGLPMGGKWSFDTDNRESLPDDVKVPSLPAVKQTTHIKAVQKLIDENFKDHPGNHKDYWIPTTRQEAHAHLKDFVEKRLNEFGPYEDAMTDRSDFVFHSALSPLMNVGLLSPEEVVREVISVGLKKKISLASIEGFVRQVIGWREFIRGIYQEFSEKQESTNFLNHKKKISEHWYNGTTGIPPLDEAIKKADRLAYNHHIERLMVIGNMMNLLEINPKEAHRWFMEMYVDSSDWVMGPNVYGMALFSDGGIFATKPYICGSNFYRKMGHYPKGNWCDEVDGLYWGFVDTHRGFLVKNPRTSMMVRTFDKMNSDRKELIQKAANSLRKRVW
jgi:deoxyribodipyrimidine photolyase-related protein